MNHSFLRYCFSSDLRKEDIEWYLKNGANPNEKFEHLSSSGRKEISPFMVIMKNSRKTFDTVKPFLKFGTDLSGLEESDLQFIRDVQFDMMESGELNF